MKKHLSILGCRGVPASHGGFETFAEYLSLYLVDRDWDVTVYCQVDGQLNGSITYDNWKNIKLVNIEVNKPGAWGTIIFDFFSIRHALKTPESLMLTLGYNTAAFCLPFRLFGIKNLINMDGLEWKREKWTFIERTWFWINERLGCWIGNHLIADHPEIKNHLASRVPRSKITTIPYCSDPIPGADTDVLQQFNVRPNNYFTIIARPEPENSILEIVQAFSIKPRGLTLLVLGSYHPDKNNYHRAVLGAASNEVRFVGAIYDKQILNSIRYHSLAYIHGHRVGGTNPSLVEALGAGSAVIAHNNRFNQWVAGDAAYYFNDVDDCALIFDDISKFSGVLTSKKEASRQRFADNFTKEKVLGQYEKLLSEWC